MENETRNIPKWELNFRKTNLSPSILLWLLVITVFILYSISDKGLFNEVIFVFFVGLINFTTIGYRNMFPIGHFAQSFALIFESLLVNLFPSVLIAQLMNRRHFNKKDKSHSN